MEYFWCSVGEVSWFPKVMFDVDNSYHWFPLLLIFLCKSFLSYFLHVEMCWFCSVHSWGLPYVFCFVAIQVSTIFIAVIGIYGSRFHLDQLKYSWLRHLFSSVTHIGLSLYIVAYFYFFKIFAVFLHFLELSIQIFIMFPSRNNWYMKCSWSIWF